MTLASALGSPTEAQSAEPPARGDLNGDGIQDTAFLDHRSDRSGRARVVVRFGRGNGALGGDRVVTELSGLEHVDIVDAALRLEDRWGDAHFFRYEGEDGSFRLLAEEELDGEQEKRPPRAAARVGSDPLLWRQLDDGLRSYGSARGRQAREGGREIAEDFELTGEVTGLVAFGRRGNRGGAADPIDAVEVRFYAVGPDGRPGPLQAEYVLAAGDPGLFVDPDDPGTLEVSLSPAFPADGRHFVGLQVVTDGRWSWRSANGGANDGVRGSHLWVQSRDTEVDDTWEVYENSLGEHRTDLSFELYGAMTAPPTISSVSPTDTTPSGRLRITGTNFGGTQDDGGVTVGGVEAIVIDWSDEAIHAYVPEGVDGAADVVVRNAVGASAPVAVQVSPRTADGRIKWSFTCDDLYVHHRVGLGPDGTVYAVDTGATAYALSPDGALLWLRAFGDDGLNAGGSDGPTVVRDDGTIYISINPLGNGSRIIALNPDGSTRWLHHQPDTQGILAGPGLGPDGNVYAAFDLIESAVLSLDGDDGSLRWSTPGDPPVSEVGQVGIEIGFGSDRFYVGFDNEGSNSVPLLYGFSYDGEQLFAVGSPGENSYPVVGLEDRVYLPVYPTGNQLGAFEPDGSLAWVTDYAPAKRFTNASVGPDGTVYAVRSGRELIAFDPDGTVLWVTTAAENETLYRPIPSPDGDILLLGGSISGASFPEDYFGIFRAYDADSGDELWTEIVPHDADGAIRYADAGAIFTPDGDMAYLPVSRNFNPDDNERCYVFALDTSGSGTGDPDDPNPMIFVDGFETGDETMWDRMRN